MGAATRHIRHRARGRGFTLFELAVCVVLIGALATVLLERLGRYQEMAERAAMEATLRLVKTGLQIRLAELIVTNREALAGRLEIDNPLHWLERRPVNYGGPWQPPGIPGNWYFDERARELVYVANAASRLEFDAGMAAKTLRFHPRVLRNRVWVAGRPVESVSGVTIEPVRRYRWQ